MVRYYGSNVIFPTRQAQAGAQAKTELLQSHAGRAKWLYEYTNGAVSSGAEPSAAKTFHTGTPGHDHSGGIMGTPILRPLFCTILGGPGSTMGASVTYWRAPNATALNTAASGTKYSCFSGSFKHVWVPYSPPDGAHTLGEISMVFFGSNVSCTFTVYAAYGNGSIQTNDSYTTGAPGASEFVVDFNNKVQLNPGKFNTIMLDVWVEPPGLGTTYLELMSVSINQYQTTP